MKRAIILMAFLMTVGTAYGATNCKDEASYPQISKPELQEAVKGKSAFVVDVNSAESFQKAHVPGAVHFGSHEKDFASLLPKDKSAMVVAYCGGPSCNAWKHAAEEACNLGYTNIRHFKGGIKGWTQN